MAREGTREKKNEIKKDYNEIDGNSFYVIDYFLNLYINAIITDESLIDLLSAHFICVSLIRHNQLSAAKFMSSITDDLL